MGTWGHGNLDSDYAREELDGRVTALLASLLARAARPTSREADEYDYTTLFVELEIAIALATANLIEGRYLPRSVAIDELALDYIAGWDAFIDELEPTAEHKRERRKAILDTFARFAKLCAPHDAVDKWAERPKPTLQKPQQKPKQKPAKPKPKPKKAKPKPRTR